MSRNVDFSCIPLNNFSNPVFVVNPDYSINYVNAALVELTGFSTAELLGRKPPFPWCGHQDVERLTKHTIFMERQGKKFERCCWKKNGELFWVEVIPKPVKTKGKLIYILINWIDITERKQAKKALEESKEFSLYLLNESPNPILVINPDTSIKYVNSALEELTGFTSAEILGKKTPFPWWNIEDKEKLSKIATNLLNSGEKFERCNFSKNGEPFWVEIKSKPIMTDGKLACYLTNWVDITERKKSEQDLNKLNEELRNLNSHYQSLREKERRQISREIHDEFGQSLAAFKMDVCWLEKRLTNVDLLIKNRLGTMNKSIDRTLQMVKWITAGLRPKLLDDIGLADAIEWLVTEFKVATGIWCITEVSQEINILSGDQATAVFRVLQEALTNVFRHSEASKVSIHLRRLNGAIVLKIKDNGKGINEVQLSDPKAFGLIGMREYIHGCRGTIKIRSLINKGTTITARVPLSRKEKMYDQDTCSR